MKEFDIKTKIRFGHHSLSSLQSIKGKKTFIVTDPFMVKSGAIHKIINYLEKESYYIFSDIVPDPSIDLVVQGIQAITDFKPQVIIALGGGSAIDAAKAIMNFARKITDSSDLEFIAVPTTSGTGSEVTSFSVITDKEKGIKYPLISDELLPDVAILDVELVQTVPDFIVADTGMDVLTHALEAYVSTDATDFSDALAEKAVQLVFEYLLRSYKDANDKEARQKMHHASCIAGIAFNLTSLGLNHAIAHVIGGKFRVPHGRTNAILLPYVVEFNANIEGYNPSQYTLAAQKYAYVAKLVGLGGATVRSCVKNLIQEIIKLQRNMDMPTTLKDCRVSIDEFKTRVDEVAHAALQDACIKTNPRITSAQDIIQILNQII